MSGNKVCYLEVKLKEGDVKEMLRLSAALLLYHVNTGAGMEIRFNEFTHKVCHCLDHQAHCGNHPQCSVKSENSGFLKKIIFSIFKAKLDKN